RSAILTFALQTSRRVMMLKSIAANGEFSLFPGMERIVTLLEGGEMLLESADRFNHTLKPLQPFAFAADQVVKAKLTEGQ
ncbi:HutD family protein, partial [Shigella sonnei]|uniref:HutD family protein n=1 Tax=Shigella sonnei TaxID=624 RepID=UPI0014929C02